MTTLCWQQCKQIGGSLRRRRRRRKKKVLGGFVSFTWGEEVQVKLIESSHFSDILCCILYEGFCMASLMIIYGAKKA